MSFEGYYQRICDKGHYYIVDCMCEFMEDPIACTVEGCNSIIIIKENIVDTTNGCTFDNKPCICNAKEVIYKDKKAITFTNIPITHNAILSNKIRRATYAKSK